MAAGPDPESKEQREAQLQGVLLQLGAAQGSRWDKQRAGALLSVLAELAPPTGAAAGEEAYGGSAAFAASDASTPARALVGHLVSASLQHEAEVQQQQRQRAQRHFGGGWPNS